MILLIRHAHAVDGNEARVDDDERWLTSKGREVARRMGDALRRRGLELDEVWTSPLVRAVQTAELVAAAAHYTGKVAVLAALAPGGRVRAVAEVLEARPGVVAVVGHESDISTLAAYLCGQPAFPAFKKGQVVVIEGGRAMLSLDPDNP
jgi:phosphohistidine phosphatase